MATSCARQGSWLHHAFVQIHPFADGNGRVARALTLCSVLQRHRYAPLVVDCFHRTQYLESLDAANQGELYPLVRLFARLETAALAGELERGEEPTAKGLSIDVAHSLAEQVASLRRRKRNALTRAIDMRAKLVGSFLSHWFTEKEKGVRTEFAKAGVSDAEVARAFVQLPPTFDPMKAGWFRGQIIRSARRAGHYANFIGPVGWANLRIRLEGLKLSFVASLHGVGQDTGVMAVTTCCEVEQLNEADEGGPSRWEDIELPNEAFPSSTKSRPNRSTFVMQSWKKYWNRHSRLPSKLPITTAIRDVEIPRCRRQMHRRTPTARPRRRAEAGSLRWGQTDAAIVVANRARC